MPSLVSKDIKKFLVVLSSRLLTAHIAGVHHGSEGQLQILPGLPAHLQLCGDGPCPLPPARHLQQPHIQDHQVNNKQIYYDGYCSDIDIASYLMWRIVKV